MILSLDRQQPAGTSPGLIDMFIEQATIGGEALIAAATSGDWPTLAREAHGLKGAASLYGLPRLAATASQLEQAGREEALPADLIQQLQHDLPEGVAALRSSASGSDRADSVEDGTR